MPSDLGFYKEKRVFENNKTARHHAFSSLFRALFSTFSIRIENQYSSFQHLLNELLKSFETPR